MRTQVISSTTVYYPETIVWLHDSNVIKLESEYPVGAVVNIYSPNSEHVTLTYYSEMNSLLFSLDDALASLLGDNISNWTALVHVYENGISVGSINFFFYVLNGKSFITRSHAMASTFYVYSEQDLYKFHLYSEEAGDLLVNGQVLNCYRGLNQYDLRSLIQNTGEHSICVRSSSTTPPRAHVTEVEDSTPFDVVVNFSVEMGVDPNAKDGGDIWGGKTTFPTCYNIVYEEVCDNFDFAELQYVDTDGCNRYLGGKLISEKDEVKSNDYSSLSTSLYKFNPSRFITSSTKTIKIAFSNIAKTAYPNDILYSDTVKLKCWDGEWRNVSIKSTNIDLTNEEYLDFEIEVIVHEL